MKILGIYGSPRESGNSDLLLDTALKGAIDVGAEVEIIYCRKLNISACISCGRCNYTGECVISDDMDLVYFFFDQINAIIFSLPIFFYGAPAQAKALVDRCQACWSKRMLAKNKIQRKNYDKGFGYIISVGATRGKNLFLAVELMAKYFYDALDMSYEGGLLLHGLEAKGAVNDHIKMLEQAYKLGKNIVVKNCFA